MKNEDRPRSSYEMRLRSDGEETQNDDQPRTKSSPSTGKIFYKPGIIEEETEETSVMETSRADSPLTGLQRGPYGGSSLLKPQMYASSSLHRIPTYSSSIGHSIRQDTWGALRPLDSVAAPASGAYCPPVGSMKHPAQDPESPSSKEEQHLIPDEWLKIKSVQVGNGSLSPGIYYPNGKRSRSHRHGTVRKARRRAILKNGECNILKSGISQRRLRFLQDMFTTLVDAQWRWTLLVFTLSFILSWLGFAVIWWLIAFTHTDLEYEHLPPQQEESGWKPCVFNIYSFTSCFLFSIETQHTIGYGSRTTTEECPEAIFIMCLQSIVGVMIQAFMVGIVFAKMTRPKHRTQTLLFSRSAVVCQRDAELCLMFRVGDLRKSHIIGASVRAQLIRSRTTKEGELLAHYQTELELHADGCDSNLFFIWPITMVHRINADSPFYGVSAADLLQERFEIVVILEGTIESTGQTTQARSSYTTSEILWGHRFVPMVNYNKERQGFEVDYSKFDETTQVDTPLCSGKELDEFYGMQPDRRSIGSPVLESPSPELYRKLHSPLASPASLVSPPLSPLVRLSDRLVADAIRRASLTRRPSVVKYPSQYFNQDASSSSSDEGKSDA